MLEGQNFTERVGSVIVVMYLTVCSYTTVAYVHYDGSVSPWSSVDAVQSYATGGMYVDPAHCCSMPI